MVSIVLSKLTELEINILIQLTLNETLCKLDGYEFLIKNFVHKMCMQTSCVVPLKIIESLSRMSKTLVLKLITSLEQKSNGTKIIFICV